MQTQPCVTSIAFIPPVSRRIVDVEQDGPIFKRERLIVLVCMRHLVIERLHYKYASVQATLRKPQSTCRYIVYCTDPIGIKVDG